MLTIYTKANCTYCDMAKKLLQNKNINYREVRVDLDDESRQFLVAAGHRSVPQLYLNDELFVEDGYQGLVSMSNEELLSKLGINNVN